MGGARVMPAFASEVDYGRGPPRTSPSRGPEPTSSRNQGYEDVTNQIDEETSQCCDPLH